MTAARWRAAFVGASIAWAALLVAAPYLASRPHASALASALIVGVYGLGSVICHQLPARSYHLWTAQMPVCARCTGIYAGAVAGAVLGVLRTARVAKVAVVLAIAALPTAISLVYEWTTGVVPSNAVRAAAGLPIGVVVAWLVVAASENQVN